jgi:hypothetical protein
VRERVLLVITSAALRAISIVMRLNLYEKIDSSITFTTILTAFLCKYDYNENENEILLI